MNRPLVACAAFCAALSFAPGLAYAASHPTPPPPDPSLHVYRETNDGGAVIVVAHGQKHSFIEGLRAKLEDQARAYERGDYSKPPLGAHVAAVDALRAGSAKIAVHYANVEDGGAITLQTKDAALAGAIHEWFAAVVRQERKLHPDGGPGLTP